MSREAKQAQFQTRGQGSKSKLILIIILLLVVAGVAVTLFIGGGSGSSGLRVVDGTIKIPLSEFADTTARFYKFQGSRGEIPIFLVKSSDGEIRAAFDTCDVCYKEKKGYRQEGNSMVCNNCNQSFRTDLINQVKGGCNPAPLQREVIGDQVVIQLAALEQGSWYFNGHPQ